VRIPGPWPFLTRLEYRFSDYGDYNGLQPERHQVALLIGYRF
jgi:outer membrane immunogenic protein